MSYEESLQGLDDGSWILTQARKTAAELTLRLLDARRKEVNAEISDIDADLLLLQAAHEERGRAEKKAAAASYQTKVAALHAKRSAKECILEALAAQHEVEGQLASIALGLDHDSVPQILTTLGYMFATHGTT